MAQTECCAVSAVQATRENLLPYFGTVGARCIANRQDLYEVTKVLEKPTPTQAEQDLIVAGLRSGHYLCMFGMHVLTPNLMTILKQQFTAQTTDNKKRQIKREKRQNERAHDTNDEP